MQGMQPSASGDKPSSSPNTNLCPTCRERPKTSWSKSCQTCEINRQRYLAAIEHEETDRQFLIALQGRSQSSIAREMRVTRQRVSQLKQDAQRRLEFLTQPLPPIPTYSTTPAQ